MRRQILMLLNLSVPDGVNLVRVNVSRVENWGVGVYVNNIANTSSITGLQPIWKTNKNIKQTKRILEKYYYQINT